MVVVAFDGCVSVLVVARVDGCSAGCGAGLPAVRSLVHSDAGVECRSTAWLLGVDAYSVGEGSDVRECGQYVRAERLCTGVVAGALECVRLCARVGVWVIWCLWGVLSR